ncbi:TadE family protein [Microbacterium marinilacus]|nr:TadE family protein [Microbacterium marinilacus]
MRGRLRASAGDDTGSAALEFLTAGVLLLVPLAYLVIALGEVQSWLLGAETSARVAARAIALGPDAGNPDAVLESVTRQYGIEAFDADVSCVPAVTSCPAAGATVIVTVSTQVTLPLIPPVLGLDRLATVPVQASSVQKVSEYWESR